MEKFEKLDNEQKELVKYWIEKYHRGSIGVERFIEKHLTPDPIIEVGMGITSRWAEIIDEKAGISDEILGFIARIETELEKLKSKL